MRQALELALEFIERVNKDGWILADFEPEMYNTITAIKEALAQQEQEPVAWKETDEVECPVCKDKGFPWPKCGHITYLEPTPPQRTWVGLTDEDIYSIIESNEPPNLTSLFEMVEWVAKAIEAKLKEKNNG